MNLRKSWGLLAILILQVMLMNNALSQPAPALNCPSQTFVMGREGEQNTFDVSELRKQREELYRMLASQFFQQSSFGAEMAAALRQLDFTAPMARSGHSNENLKRFIAFLGTDAFSTSMHEMLFACGSVMDAVAAQLSLKISKDDGERLAFLLADPAFNRLAAFMPQLTRLPTPPHLQLSTSAAGERFLVSLIEKCRRFGVETPSCEALRFQR